MRQTGESVNSFNHTWLGAVAGHKASFYLHIHGRMVEEGHYPELSRLLKTIVDQAKSYQRDYDEMRQRKLYI